MPAANRIARWLRWAGLVVAAAGIASAAGAQPGETVYVRGILNDVGSGGMIGTVLNVSTREGPVVFVFLQDAFKVVPVAAAEIGPGTIVAAAVDGATGEAMAVQVGAEIEPGVRPWDLAAGGELVVGEATAVADRDGGAVVTVTFPGGERMVAVAAATPVFTTAAPTTDLSRLQGGLYVFIEATRAGDGTLSTGLILVETDGVRPAL